MPLNLVVQTAFLGDLLLSIPLLKKCREMWPEHRLGLVCRKGFGDFFLKINLVDEVFEIEKGNSESYHRVRQQLKTFEIRNLISPHESLRTALFVSKINARRKISYINKWNFFFFNQRIRKNNLLPDPLRQLSLLSRLDRDLALDLNLYYHYERPYLPGDLGRLSSPPRWGRMSVKDKVLALTDIYEDVKKRFNLQDFDKPRAVLLFPGSVWNTKRWTEEGFTQTGVELSKQGYPIYVMGGPGEEELAQDIATYIPGAINLAGKTKVIESAQLIARAALVIGNDSASTHLAAACDTPLISIFGPTILEFGFRPWSGQSFVIQREGLACRPCGKHGHKECPIGTHECMTGIATKEVLRAAEVILHRL